MNAPDQKAFLPDIQSQIDARGLAIDAVGVSGVRYPISLRAGTRVLSTVATCALTVGLAAGVRGTHMSRFIELLEANQEPLDPARFKAMLNSMLQRLDATHGALEMRFAYFVTKTAPVSGVHSLLDYDVMWRAERTADGHTSFQIEIVAPVTSLCPCSKEISEYGAHNQRSHVRIKATLAHEIFVEDLIGIAERGASCEVYGLLKRPDEKYVTERAYDNPKFVEDLVRDVALSLDVDARVGAFVVEAENFESIHNHSAFARISRNKDAKK